MPCGAIKVFERKAPDVTGLDPPVRYFDGTLRVIGIEQSTTKDIEVEICGQQWATATCVVLRTLGTAGLVC